MVKAKRGLGKGLGALISDENSDVSRETSGVRKIDINMIKPNKEQPRNYFNEDKLENLADSIKEHGVIQPIILKSISNGFEIVAGERRWRASRKAGLTEIPAIVKELDDIEVVQIALIENLQREDLNSIEEAIAYKSLIEEYAFTQDKVSKVVGKSRSHIANVVRLLSLSDEVQNYIIEDKISGGHGRALVAVEDSKLQMNIVLKIIEDGLSVRDTERLISNLGNSKEPNKEKEIFKDNNAIYAERMLKDRFDTKVNVKMGKRKGKIEIEFYGKNDLSRILELIKFD